MDVQGYIVATNSSHKSHWIITQGIRPYSMQIAWVSHSCGWAQAR